MRKKIIEQYLKNAHKFPFLLICGWRNTSQLMQNTIKEIYPESSKQDLLIIKDYSAQQSKRHIIKVDNVEYIKDTEGNVYHDKWTRQIREWLQTSSLSGRKIVLIENIHRATIQAINALLKSLEEPLPGRLVIATTENKDLVLSTILSRATIVNIPLSLKETFDIQEEEREKVKKIENYLSKRDTVSLYQELKKAEKEGTRKKLIDARVVQADQEKNYNLIILLQKHLAMIDANVSVDTVLFSLALTTTRHA